MSINALFHAANLAVGGTDIAQDCCSKVSGK